MTVGFGATSVTLDQNDVNAILSGDTSSLGSLSGAVSSLGVDPIQLATYLDTLI